MVELNITFRWFVLAIACWNFETCHVVIASASFLINGSLLFELSQRDFGSMCYKEINNNNTTYYDDDNYKDTCKEKQGGGTYM
jgi:hypothetical protein